MDEQAFEREALEATRSLLETQRDELRHWGKELRDLRLEGSYPESKLVVEYEDLRDGTSGEAAFDLWGDWFRASDGSRDHPETVAVIISANILVPPR